MATTDWTWLVNLRYLLQEDTASFREATESDTSDYLVSMAGGNTRYPILIATDTLIAVANSLLWTHLTDNVGLTTTHVCKQELERHAEETRATARDGTRPY